MRAQDGHPIATVCAWTHSRRAEPPQAIICQKAESQAAQAVLKGLLRTPDRERGGSWSALQGMLSPVDTQRRSSPGYSRRAAAALVIDDPSLPRVAEAREAVERLVIELTHRERGGLPEGKSRATATSRTDPGQIPLRSLSGPSLAPHQRPLAGPDRRSQPRAMGREPLSSASCQTRVRILGS
ncbi:MAG: hypothetical protein ACYDD0_05690 [Candidatus Dormibacteria bacterium]